MNPLVRQLFKELAALTPAERERALAERETAKRVRTEVDALLRFDSADDASLRACVVDTAAEMLVGVTTDPLGECGPYRLVRLLGAGGMGTVYLAERRDNEIQQRVAVKLLTGGSRPAWRKRFLQERTLLASLNHRSIVHVIDAGHTVDGQPYLAMEYIEGLPIDLFAAQVGIRERLGLFLGVCEGVSHAHRHLIIHRDLKPPISWWMPQDNRSCWISVLPNCSVIPASRRALWSDCSRLVMRAPSNSGEDLRRPRPTSTRSVPFFISSLPAVLRRKLEIGRGRQRGPRQFQRPPV